MVRSFLIQAGSLILSTVAFAQRPPMDPNRTVGVESCRECHQEMVEAWEKSSHSTSFETLAGSAASARMAEILSIKPAEIPMNASCVRCHYTQEPLFSIPQSTEGVSCESCHGGGLDWMDEHNRRSLSRGGRVETATEKGMVHPATLFRMVATCYECHVVDDEQLVNRVGHPAISEGFEFLSWYSGEVMHNFLSPIHGDGVRKHLDTMQEIPQARKRMLYLVGKLQHVAQSLAALSRTSDAPTDPEGRFVRLENGDYTYGVQHALEVKRLGEDIEAVLEKAAIREFAEVLVLLRGLDFSTGHNADWKVAAEKVSRLAEEFCEKHDGSELGAIDPILKELSVR